MKSKFTYSKLFTILTAIILSLIIIPLTVQAAGGTMTDVVSLQYADTKNKQARLVLVDLAQNIIKDAFSLLGIACPEEM